MIFYNMMPKKGRKLGRVSVVAAKKGRLKI
jgi:hypothetical protein